MFSCNIEGADYHYTITCDDATAKEALSQGNVTLGLCYKITAWASAQNSKSSDVTTAMLYFLPQGDDDDEQTGIVVPNKRGVVISSNAGVVTLRGLNAGEEVRVYSDNGSMIGAVRADGSGVASCQASGHSLVIVKIADRSLKVSVN